MPRFSKRGRDDASPPRELAAHEERLLRATALRELVFAPGRGGIFFPASGFAASAWGAAAHVCAWDRSLDLVGLPARPS